MSLEQHAGRLRLRCERADGLAYERADVNGLAMESERARLGERERPQILEEPREHPRLIQDRGEMRLIRRVNAIDQRLEIALHHRERRAELVAHVRDQGAALPPAPLPP